MGFSLPSVILRFIAVAVLLSGIADYSAFDVGDPVAPMGSAGIFCSTRKPVHRRLVPVAVQKADSQDDGCICCAAGFTVHRVLISCADVIAATNTPSAHSPSDSAPVRIDRPPRT